MRKLVALVLAATFAVVSFQVVAQDKKPSADDCKKDPKMKGCEPAKKYSAVRSDQGRASPCLFL